ncbi:MAG: energy-coupling factor ABC transporter ATP-binding protein [Coriobacteriia bacterium]|nr:energy-coupling factor ABC transporter ATP-binding protein [Coriobacteriia bacterium]
MATIRTDKVEESPTHMASRTQCSIGEVHVRSLSFSYPESEVPTLSSLSFQAAAGDFILLCGQTGSGKTTLLRHLVPALTPHGQSSGQLEIGGSVGFVQQDPDNQIVTDIVFHELAFALESQGLATQIIRRKVAEIASYFGLEYLLEAKTHSLSGGQKQILNLAATLVAEPDILVLDEPTSELDPIAAQNFLRHLARVNRELGTTVLCCEHRLEEVLEMCDKVLLMKSRSSSSKDAASRAKGLGIQSYTPKDFVESCRTENQNFALYLPEPTRIALASAEISAKIDRYATQEAKPETNKEQACRDWPLDVRSGRRWLKSTYSLLAQASSNASESEATTAKAPAVKLKATTIPNYPESSGRQSKGNPSVISKSNLSIITIRDLCFRYDKAEPFILKYLNAEFSPGQTHGIVGGNAAGKSTLLGLIAGIYKPQLGKIRKDKNLRLAALPQNPKASFVCDTLAEDFYSLGASTSPEEVLQIAQDMDIVHLLDQHPYDLSGGEAQKAALAKVLLTKPDILLLDEPTKGLDAYAKQEVGHIFDRLAAQGKTLIIVTHDLPFAARHTQTCSLLANGELIAQDQTHNFFLNNSFYTTPTNRMTRNIIDGCVTVNDALEVLNPK